MPWTPKQERYMWANHPALAKRVMHENNYRTKPPKPPHKAAVRRRLSRNPPAQTPRRRLSQNKP